MMWWTTWGVLVAIGAAVASLSRRPVAGRHRRLRHRGALRDRPRPPWSPHLRYRRWRYEIRERDLFLSRGSLFFVLTLIPFDRIQYVETHQGPLDLAFGLMQLVVYTAAGRAARIPGLAPEEAGSLREELSKVAGTQSV